MTGATQTNSLKDVTDKAQEMHQANRVSRYKRDLDPGPAWLVIPEWQKLSWFREAAAELGVEL